MPYIKGLQQGNSGNYLHCQIKKGDLFWDQKDYMKFAENCTEWTSGKKRHLKVDGVISLKSFHGASWLGSTSNFYTKYYGTQIIPKGAYLVDCDMEYLLWVYPYIYLDINHHWLKQMNGYKVLACRIYFIRTGWRSETDREVVTARTNSAVQFPFPRKLSIHFPIQMNFRSSSAGYFYKYICLDVPYAYIFSHALAKRLLETSLEEKHSHYNSG